MPKILITVNDGLIARNILRSFVLEKILAKGDMSVGLITYSDKAAGYEKEFGSERVKVFSVPVRQLTFFERILSYLVRNGLRTETILMDQRTHINGRYGSFFFKRFITYVFGGNRIFHYLIRKMFLLRKPSSVMEELFFREKPDLLFSTDIQCELDFDAISAARASIVKIIGMVRSWDNLTSRGGLMPYIPQKLLVWDPFLYRQAVKIQHIPEDKLKIVGIPQYDWYVKKEIIKSREEFLRQFGIDPLKKVILFAGEGAFHAPHEVEVLEILSNELKKRSIVDSQNIAVIFRPHPAFKVDSEYAKKLDNVIFDNMISLYTGGDPSSWEMGKENIIHLVNSLAHADLIVTTASTMIIDAIAFDKPVISIAFDGKSKEPYYNSVRRYYRDYTHHIELCKNNGFAIAYNKEELVSFISQCLINPSSYSEGRKKIFKEFIWQMDRKSAERIAEVIILGLNH